MPKCPVSKTSGRSYQVTRLCSSHVRYVDFTTDAFRFTEIILTKEEMELVVNFSPAASAPTP